MSDIQHLEIRTQDSWFTSRKLFGLFAGLNNAYLGSDEVLLKFAGISLTVAEAVRISGIARIIDIGFSY